MTKPTKWHVCPAKTQIISLGIHPVWSESSLSAWRKLGSLATHWVHSEDTDQTGRKHCLRYLLDYAGPGISIGSVSHGMQAAPSSIHMSGIFGHEKISRAEEQLSLTGERICTKYLGGLPRNSVVRVTYCTRNDLICVERPKIEIKLFAKKVSWKWN